MIIPSLRKKQIFSLDVGLLVSGTQYRGDFEERIQNLITDLEENKTMILFIDEFHTILSAGGGEEGSLNAGNMLKPALARSNFECIAATTFFEYKKIAQKDPALVRRFKNLEISEPTTEVTLLILDNIRPKYELHYGVKILDDTLYACVKLSIDYVPDRFLPDKAIDLLDETCSYVKHTKPRKLENIGERYPQLISLERERGNIALINEDFEQLANSYTHELEVRQLVTNFYEKEFELEWDIENDWIYVTDEDVQMVVSSWTGIPTKVLSENEKTQELDIEERFKARVVGQTLAIQVLANAAKRARVGLTNPNRPIASFLFAGPTGVGKTELAKSLAEIFYGSESSMLRLDMSEYMQRFNVSRLLGSPPGYIGFESGGILTEKIRQKPYTLVLFDEIEKADGEIFNILLQILDDARLSDSKGRAISFKNTIIILTTNIGAKQILEIEKEFQEKGFVSLNDGINDSFFDDSSTATANFSSKYKKMSRVVKEQLRLKFKPEFLNRIDEIIVFEQLTENDIDEITKLLVDQLRKRIRENSKIFLIIDSNVVDYIAKEGFDPIFGARPVRRALNKIIENPLSSFILSSPLIKPGAEIIATLDTSNNCSFTVIGEKKVDDRFSEIKKKYKEKEKEKPQRFSESNKISDNPEIEEKKKKLRSLLEEFGKLYEIIRNPNEKTENKKNDKPKRKKKRYKNGNDYNSFY